MIIGGMRVAIIKFERATAFVLICFVVGMLSRLVAAICADAGLGNVAFFLFPFGLLGPLTLWLQYPAYVVILALVWSRDRIWIGVVILALLHLLGLASTVVYVATAWAHFSP